MVTTTTPHPTWFVTGASSGIGLALADAAANRGDNVVAVARDVAKLDELVERHGARVLAVFADVREADAVEHGDEVRGRGAHRRAGRRARAARDQGHARRAGPDRHGVRGEPRRGGHDRRLRPDGPQGAEDIGELPPEAFNSLERVAEAILVAADAERPPLRLVTGSKALEQIEMALRSQLDELEDWRATSEAVDRAPATA